MSSATTSSGGEDEESVPQEEEAAENEQPDPAERLALCELCGLDLDRNTSALVQVVCNQKQCRERQVNAR